jgi:hypothetical protein
VVSFWAAIAGEGIRVHDVTVLCEGCHAGSGTAHQWDYWNHLLAKADRKDSGLEAVGRLGAGE